MFFLKWLFKKSSIKRLHAGGHILSDNQQKFYVDSDTQISLRDKNVIIFRKEIRKVLNNDFTDTSERTRLTDLEKNQIALKAKRALESEGFDVKISPEFPIEFSITNK